MDIDNETLQLYVEETEEHLADIENDLLSIENMGADIDDDLVNKVFRAAHSVKGGAGFMGLNNIKELSHKIENILGLIRDREMKPNSKIINVLLGAFDRLKELLERIDESNEMDISEHTNALKKLSESNLSLEENAITEQMRDICLPDGRKIFKIPEFEMTQAKRGGKNIYVAEYDLIHDIHDTGKSPMGVLNLLRQSGVIIETLFSIESLGSLEDDEIPNRVPFFVLHASIIEPDLADALYQLDSRYVYVLPEKGNLKVLSEYLPEYLAEKTSATKSPQNIPLYEEEPEPEKKPEKPKALPKVEKISKKAEKILSPKASPKASEAKETSLRVNISLLDSLMNLAGELVLSRNQLLQAVSSDNQHLLEIAKQRIDIVTSELQEAIMLTRMQPIGKIFDKFPRVVRDLAKTLGKEINLVLEGRDVELDKSIIEGLSDPLTHMLRNSVDHGIEAPEKRIKDGKSEAGEILMHAFHEAGHINIEITDDGKGIDGNLLAEKAVAKGLISEEQVRVMSEKEKVGLIFLPGFSTAEKISDVSGRGVGMDVVKSNLDKLGGLVDVHSVVGQGTAVHIKLPLTLAIIPSLLVSVGKERYAIPQVNLDELLRIPAKQVKERIEIVGDAKVVRLRGFLLPVLNLAEILSVKKDASLNESRAVNIAVVSAGGFKYGLVVDALHDSEEIVVKPLGMHLKKCREYAGATILGDGRVALILDLGNLARRATLTSLEDTSLDTDSKRESSEAQKKTEHQSFLIFRSARDEQFGVPLSLVARIEKVNASDIEKVGDRKVLQYRGGSIPLFTLHDVAKVKPIEDQKQFIVLVFTISSREFGLLATGPVDAIEIPVKVDERVFKQPGILGSVIIDHRTTLIVDIYGFIRSIKPEWMEQSQESMGTILLAEDSEFFREQMKSFMEDAGYTVIAAEDGKIAWDILGKERNNISLVITDIEMPNMNGLEFSRKIKKHPEYSKLPIIAVTSLSGEKDKIAGQKAGVDDYQVKLDRERLLASIHHYMEESQKRKNKGDFA